MNKKLVLLFAVTFVFTFAIIPRQVPVACFSDVMVPPTAPTVLTECSMFQWLWVIDWLTSPNGWSVTSGYAYTDKQELQRELAYQAMWSGLVAMSITGMYWLRGQYRNRRIEKNIN